MEKEKVFTPKILIIGDNEHLINELKSENLFELTIVENGIKAWKYLEEPEVDFDAIICDMFVMGDTGISFFLKYKTRINLTPAIPFIIYSKNYRHSIRINAYRNGVDDYIFSPLNCDNILHRILYLKKYHAQYIFNPPKTEELNLKPYKTPLLKRAFDITMASGAILFLSPIFLFTAIAIFIESPGKVFYSSKRVGANFRTFDFYKFRSMYMDADKRLKEVAHLNQYKSIIVEEECSECAKLPPGEFCSPTYLDDTGKAICERIIKLKRSSEVAFLKIENDPRITKVGKFIRNTSIDELPQLINILKGDMSVVGNRPLPVSEANSLTKGMKGKRLELGLRFHCAAGLTGLWQVELRGKDGIMSEDERFELDKQYALNNSFLGDIKLIFRTFGIFMKNQNV